MHHASEAATFSQLILYRVAGYRGRFIYKLVFSQWNMKNHSGLFIFSNCAFHGTKSAVFKQLPVGCRKCVSKLGRCHTVARQLEWQVCHCLCWGWVRSCAPAPIFPARAAQFIPLALGCLSDSEETTHKLPLAQMTNRAYRAYRETTTTTTTATATATGTATTAAAATTTTTTTTTLTRPLF